MKDQLPSQPARESGPLQEQPRNGVATLLLGSTGDRAENHQSIQGPGRGTCLGGIL